MSEPKRYEAMGPEVIATPTGEFVRYEDYARLKAEVERLTKAGDAAIEHLRWQGGKHTKEVIIPAWNAAKESKQP